MSAGFQLYLDADNIRQSMEHLNEVFSTFTDLLNRIDTASAQAPEQQPRNIYDALGGPNPLPPSPLMHKFEAWHEVCRQILVQRARSPTTEKQRREQLENEAAVKASAKAYREFARYVYHLSTLRGLLLASLQAADPPPGLKVPRGYEEHSLQQLWECARRHDTDWYFKTEAASKMIAGPKRERHEIDARSHAQTSQEIWTYLAHVHKSYLESYGGY